MARSGNRRRRSGSTSFHSQSHNPHDDADFANQNENYNGGSDHTRHKHGIGVGKPASRQAADDQSRRKDGSDRLRSDRRHQNGHHHPSVQQRWEGKEASVNDGEDGKASRFQDYALYLASRAKELKEEGNRRFQRKDYAGAMEQYELALQLIDQGHPDRAILHSNRAACLMQMKPPNYEEAVRECGLALDVHPGFGRALLRRARAYETLGKYSLALDDVQRLLHNDGNHPDAVEMEARIRGLLRGHGDEKSSQQDLRDSTPYNPSSRSTQTPPSSNRTIQTPPSSSQMLRIEADEMSLFRRVCNDPFRWHSSSTASVSPPKTDSLYQSTDRNIHSDNSKVPNSRAGVTSETPASSPMQPLKLIYDHDIRLAEMPVNCKFGDLRKIVKSKFPSAKAVLIKYKDIEGDLVTITSTKELRLAQESSTARGQRMVATPSEPHGRSGIASHILEQLRLHVVDVPLEQEPYDKEDYSLIDVDESFPEYSNAILEYSKDRSDISSSHEKKEHDKWLSDFADLFRVHLGIDANGRFDLNDIGVDLCSEALEEVATTEEAHKLFESACIKFREMVALGYLNWGNVYMCVARRQLPHDSEDGKIDFCDRLQEAFDWAEAQYALAKEKFELSLQVKPNFCDAMLSLGQKDFERAKLKWSLAIANQTDLSTWDSSSMLALFHNAEEQMKIAAMALEQSGSEEGHDCEEGLRSHIYLLWGNILYEHSQVGFRLGHSAWKELLDASVDKYKAAGAPSSDIETALRSHLSNSSLIPEAIVPDGSAADEQNTVHEIIQEKNVIVPDKSSMAPNDRGVNVEIGVDETDEFSNDDKYLEIGRTDEVGRLLNDGKNLKTEGTDDIRQVLNDEKILETEGSEDDKQDLHNKSSGSHHNEAIDYKRDFAKSNEKNLEIEGNHVEGQELHDKSTGARQNEATNERNLEIEGNDDEGLDFHDKLAGARQNEATNERNLEIEGNDDEGLDLHDKLAGARQKEATNSVHDFAKSNEKTLEIERNDDEGKDLDDNSAGVHQTDATNSMHDFAKKYEKNLQIKENDDKGQDLHDKSAGAHQTETTNNMHEISKNKEKNLAIQGKDDKGQDLHDKSAGAHQNEAIDSTHDIEKRNEKNLEIERNDDKGWDLQDKPAGTHQNEATDNVHDFKNGLSNERIVSSCNGLNSTIKEHTKIHLPDGECEKNHAQINDNQEEILGNFERTIHLNEIELGDDSLNNTRPNGIVVKTWIKDNDLPGNENRMNEKEQPGRDPINALNHSDEIINVTTDKSHTFLENTKNSNAHSSLQ